MNYLKIMYSFVLKGFTWIWVFFLTTVPMVLAIGFMVMADFVVAIIAARKQKQEVTSKKMRPTIGKFVSYAIGITVAHVVEVQFLADFPAMKLVAGLIAYIELKSINENLEKINGVNLFKAILEKLKIDERSK